MRSYLINMEKKKASIAIDMDGVIADTIGHFVDFYNREHGTQFSRKVFEGKREFDALPNEAVKKYVRTPGFFRNVPVMKGAQEALLYLSDKFDIYIVSAAMEFPQSLSEKKEWLEEHFNFIHWRNIIFCGDKSVIATDYMIDDHVKNLDYFTGKSILFTAEHNLDIDRHLRVNNWQEAVAFLHKQAI